MLIGLVIIFLLTILNGLLAMSEVAIISVRKIRLQQRAQDGDMRAQRALELARDPNRFLSTIQIGITLIGVLMGAFGSATIASDLARVFAQVSFLERYSNQIAFTAIVLFTTYLSLVIGELVPKQLALLAPETIAKNVAGPILLLSRLTAPVVWFLSVSNKAVLWLLPIRTSVRASVTDEDIKAMLWQGVREGVFEESEPEMVTGALRLDDLTVGAIMIPRTDIIWLDLNQTEDEIIATITANERTRFPIAQNEIDNVLGFINTKDLLNRALLGKPFDLRASLHEPIFIPETAPASRALEMFKQAGDAIAIVIGEHGGVEGLITINDIVEEVVGDVDQEDPQAIKRADGSWLIDGMLPITQFHDLFNVKPPDEDFSYQTLSGFVLTHLGHIPTTSETFSWQGLDFEVVDLDGRRIDKVLVTPRK